jgi:hypothetical protein
MNSDLHILQNVKELAVTYFKIYLDVCLEIQRKSHE